MSAGKDTGAGGAGHKAQRGAGWLYGAIASMAHDTW